MSDYNLTHLKQLESESIHIIREVVAEFNNPVMLYSIGMVNSQIILPSLMAWFFSVGSFSVSVGTFSVGSASISVATFVAVALLSGPGLVPCVRGDSA